MATADPTAFFGPIVVTLVYIGLYYGFQLNILRVKLRLNKDYESRGEKFDRYFGADRYMLAADRLQLNTLEHMPPFLVLLWLNAVFVSVTAATLAGGVYVGARAVYPLLIGDRLGRNIKSSVMLSTGTGYAVICYFVGALAWAAS